MTVVSVAVRDGDALGRGGSGRGRRQSGNGTPGARPVREWRSQVLWLVPPEKNDIYDHFKTLHSTITFN